MYKKVIGVLLCLVFLLSISCVVADDTIETSTMLESDDMNVIDEYDTINDDEIIINEYDEYYENNISFESELPLKLNTTGVVMS